MKKHIFITLLALFISVSGFAQANNTGTFNVRIGGNINAGLTLTTLQVGNLASDVDSSGVLAVSVPIYVDFGVHKLLSVGAGFTTGSWLNEDPDDNDIEIVKKKTNQVKFGLKFYPVSNENFNLYLGYNLGIGGFNTTKIRTFSSTTEYQKWKGTSNNINLGFNAFFGGGLGMYFEVGYTGYNLDIKEFTATNALTEIDYIADWNVSANSRIKGIQVGLGLAYKFGL